MHPNIHTLTLGMDQCYLIQDRGTIMIDGGFPGQERAFRKALARTAVSSSDIRLVIITHGHFDHVGSASQVKKLTSARIAMHHADKAQLDRDPMTWPPGVTVWGRISRALFKPVMSLLRFQVPPVDVLLNDDGLSLEPYGVPGRIIHTPGHSPGSVTVLLDTGDAFVGCLAQNSLPFCLRPSLPIYAENLDQVKQSWRRLVAEGAKTIYPGHGKPFPIEAIQSVL